MKKQVINVDDVVICGKNKYKLVSPMEVKAIGYSIGEQIFKKYGSDFYGIAIGHGGIDIKGHATDYFRIGRKFDPRSYYIVIRSYEGKNQVSEPKVVQGLGKIERKNLKDKNIVVFDDVSDSGKTFKCAEDYFNGEKFADFPIKEFATASAYRKENSIFEPDFTSGKFIPKNLWLIFPREMGESGGSILEEHGLEQGIEILKKLNYELWLVDKICSNLGLDEKEYKDVIYKIFSKTNGGKQI